MPSFTLSGPHFPSGVTVSAYPVVADIGNPVGPLGAPTNSQTYAGGCTFTGLSNGRYVATDGSRYLTFTVGEDNIPLDLATQAELDAHVDGTASVHGITSTASLETTSGATAKVAAHEADTTNVHGITNTTDLAGGVQVLREAPLNFADSRYGGVGNGSTDNAAAFTAAFAALPAGGGEIIFPPGEYVTSAPIRPPQYTKLRGMGAVSWDANLAPVRISSMAGFTGGLLHGTAAVGSVTVENLAFNGRRSSVNDTIGIRVENCQGWVFRDIHISAFRGQGFKGEAGTDLFVDNMWIVGCCLQRTGLLAVRGCFEHNGSDAILHGVRASASIQTDWGEGIGGPGSGYICGILLKVNAANAFMTSCFGHLAQTGIYIQTDRCHISSCRTDLNEAGGWVIEGGYNRIMGCSSYRDGQGADNVYDGMTTSGGGGANVVIGFQAEALATDIDTLRHAIVDAQSSGQLNQYYAPAGIGISGSVVHGQGTVKPMVAGWAFSTAIFELASAASLAIPAYADVISVTGITTITSIPASYAGRRITLVFAAALTVTDGSNLKLNGNFVTTADDTLTLVCDGTNWIETGRSAN